MTRILLLAAAAALLSGHAHAWDTAPWDTAPFDTPQFASASAGASVAAGKALVQATLAKEGKSAIATFNGTQLVRGCTGAVGGVTLAPGSTVTGPVITNTRVNGSVIQVCH